MWGQFSISIIVRSIYIKNGQLPQENLFFKIFLDINCVFLRLEYLDMSYWFYGLRSLMNYSPWGCKRVRHDLKMKQQSSSKAAHHDHHLSVSMLLCNSFFLSVGTEKAMAPHSSTLAWKIPWMEEPGGLQSMGSRRVRHNWATSLSLFTFMHWRRKWQPTPVFLPGESQGLGSLVGCRLWGRTELDTTEATCSSSKCGKDQGTLFWGTEYDKCWDVPSKVILQKKKIWLFHWMLSLALSWIIKPGGCQLQFWGQKPSLDNNHMNLKVGCSICQQLDFTLLRL